MSEECTCTPQHLEAGGYDNGCPEHDVIDPDGIAPATPSIDGGLADIEVVEVEADPGVWLTEAEESAIGMGLFQGIEMTQWENARHPVLPLIEALIAQRVAAAKAEGLREGWDECFEWCADMFAMPAENHNPYRTKED